MHRLVWGREHSLQRRELEFVLTVKLEDRARRRALCCSELLSSLLGLLCHFFDESVPIWKFYFYIPLVNIYFIFKIQRHFCQLFAFLLTIVHLHFHRPLWRSIFPWSFAQKQLQIDIASRYTGKLLAWGNGKFGIQFAQQIRMFPPNNGRPVNLIIFWNLFFFKFLNHLQDFIAHIKFIGEGGRRIIIHSCN